VAFDFFPSQIGFFNPLLIVIFVPLFAAVVYPGIKKVIPLTYVNKIAIGMVLAALSFTVIAYVQMQMDAGVTMSIMWQVLAYVILTAAEIFISITALEFSYTQAPNSMKSFILSFYLVSVALGNLFTALVNAFIQNPDGSVKLEGASYFWFFTAMMAGAAILFYLVNRNYKEETYIQSREDAEDI
jgi:POT family proton-dependent oligopeptide transporter